MTVLNLSQLIHVIDGIIVLNGQQNSNTIDVKGLTPVAIRTHAELTSTKISFNVSPDADLTAFPLLPYVNVAGGAVEVNIIINTHIGFLPADFTAVRLIQFRTDVAEGADRNFQLICRRIS